MKSAQEVYAEVIRAHHDLEKIPPAVHLFCPKVCDEDDEDYENPDVPGDEIDVEEKKTRIQAAQERLRLVSWASLILGIEEDQADKWAPEFRERTEVFLTKCDACVRLWHMNRKPLRNRLLKYV